MFPNDSCKHFFIVLNMLRPFYEEKKIYKTEIETLPPCFKKTVIGFKHGARAQWRGPFNLHVREYDLYFLVHRDISNPDVDLPHAIEHLVFDVMTPNIREKYNTLSKIQNALINQKIQKEREQIVKKSRRLIWKAKIILKFKKIPRLYVKVHRWVLKHAVEIFASVVLFCLVLCIIVYFFYATTEWLIFLILYSCISILALVFRKRIVELELVRCPFFDKDSGECLYYYFHLLKTRDLESDVIRIVEEYISYLEQIGGWKLE